MLKFDLKKQQRENYGNFETWACKLSIVIKKCSSQTSARAFTYSLRNHLQLAFNAFILFSLTLQTPV